MAISKLLERRPVFRFLRPIPQVEVVVVSTYVYIRQLVVSCTVVHKAGLYIK